MAMENLVIIFTVPLKLKVAYGSSIPDLSLQRTSETKLSTLYCHLQQHLNLSPRGAWLLLPIAVCRSNHSQQGTKLPLVSEHMWRNLIDKYSYDRVRVVLEKRLVFDISPPLCVFLRRKELKTLDLSYYMPSILERHHIVSLGEDVLYRDYYVKPKLRRGLWMHLLGVFHPALHTLEQREGYIQNLRRIYDNLKGKLGDDTNWSPQVHHLRESIHRDAIRTDPNEPFLAVPSNMSKLVEIITVYTLEHSEIKYTQGMTDLLSPILYVMEREDDAYICFAAMFERIKVNFTEWCEGTLNKLERLKHLCEVLDPELFDYLSQLPEDPFVLFFGMVLIECRREFGFQDGLHLLEVLWAAALHRDAPSLEDVTLAKWASFMTSVSTEIVFQTFGEAEAPYSTHPLDEDSGEMLVTRRRGGSNASRQSSTARFIPRPGSARSRGNESLPGSSPSPVVNELLLSSHAQPIKRSMSLPDNYVVISNVDFDQSNEAKSEGDLCVVGGDEREESDDVIGELKLVRGVARATEMADMSSVSSNSNGQFVRTCSREVSTSVEINGNEPVPDRKGCVVSSEPNSNTDVFLHGHLEIETDNEGACPMGEVDTDMGGVSSRRGHLKRSQTLPRDNTKRTNPNEDRRDSYSVKSNSTLPRTHSTLPPAAFLHHLSRPSLSSPYVSGIRALDPHINYPENDMDPFGDDSRPSSPHSPLGFSPLSCSPSHSQGSTFRYPSPLASCPSPLATLLPPKDNTLSQNSAPVSSLEGSLQASHVMSDTFPSEQGHPNVNRETSLQIRMADAFSLFVCLAILVRNRRQILSERLDFISVSMMLNDQAETQSLSQILKIARQLHRVYYSYQMTYYEHSADQGMFETWLDNPAVVTTTTSST